MNPAWPSAVARRVGLGGEVKFTGTRCAVTLHIPCQGWGKHLPHYVDVPVAPGAHPDAIAKKLLHQGWRIGHRLVCPDGRKKVNEKRNGAVNTKGIAMATTSDMALDAAQPPQPTPAAGRARRLVYMALEDYYDEGRRAYKPGHTDAGIARECGVAESVVKTIREESYGPLAVPSELSGLVADLAVLRKESAAVCEAQKQAIDAISTRLDLLIKRNGWVNA